jgi:hypothetical protein
MSRAGAADHASPTVSSGQSGTTTPQVNPPASRQRDRWDLAYNDEVTGELPRRLRGACRRGSK